MQWLILQIHFIRFWRVYELILQNGVSILLKKSYLSFML